MRLHIQKPKVLQTPFENRETYNNVEQRRRPQSIPETNSKKGGDNRLQEQHEETRRELGRMEDAKQTLETT